MILEIYTATGAVINTASEVIGLTNIIHPPIIIINNDDKHNSKISLFIISKRITSVTKTNNNNK